MLCGYVNKQNEIKKISLRISKHDIKLFWDVVSLFFENSRKTTETIEHGYLYYVFFFDDDMTFQIKEIENNKKFVFNVGVTYQY